MKIKLLNVVWHDKEPVFSIDWHPSGRIATGGADKEVKIWRVENIASAKPQVKYVCSLVRHMSTVNAVRFSPNGRFLASGSDDGFICIWELQKQTKSESSRKEAVEKGQNEKEKGEEEEEEEVWTVYKSIKAPARDVYDLAWSVCSRFIVGGTSENTSFVGSARSGSVLSVARDHSHFIQGVSWDPLNKYVVTQSSDQTARVYITAKGNSGKMNIRYVIKSLRLPEHGSNATHKRDLSASSTTATPVKKKSKTTENDKAKGGSGPQGEAGAKASAGANVERESTEENGNKVEDEEEEVVEEEDVEEEEDAIEEAKSSTRPKMFLSEVANTFFRRNSWSPDGSLLILPAGIFRTQPSDDGARSSSAESVKVANTAYVFSRGDFRRPVCHFPGHEKVVVATKFCPALFKLRGTKTPPVPLPYRMVVAIATTDSVAIYDTETMHALGVANRVHFSEITDLAWIEDDGLHLIMSSRDGFCSLISFDKDELGERLDKTEYPEVMEKIREIRNTPFKAQMKEAKEAGGDRTNETASAVNSNPKSGEDKPQRKRIKPVLVSQNP